jgi:hypothetical protein
MKKSKQFVRVEAKQAMIDGVMAGVRENTAQLFNVILRQTWRRSCGRSFRRPAGGRLGQGRPNTFAGRPIMDYRTHNL